MNPITSQKIIYPKTKPLKNNLNSPQGIKYTEKEPENLKFSISKGLKFCAENILKIYRDKDNDGIITPKDIGLLGFMLDFNKNGKLVPEEKLTHFMFEDATESLDGVVTVNEIKKSSLIFKSDFHYVVERLKKLYFGHNLNQISLNRQEK